MRKVHLMNGDLSDNLLLIIIQRDVDWVKVNAAQYEKVLCVIST